MSVDLPEAKKFEKSTSNFYIIGTLCVLQDMLGSLGCYVLLFILKEGPTSWTQADLDRSC